MKKNKTVAYMLAATLLVGGTFIGTKALFTDTGKSDTNLVLTMGNLHLDVKESVWEVVNNNSEAQGQQNEGEISNFAKVKPGDTFRKYVSVLNKGTLNQTLEMTGGEISENLKNVIEIDTSDLKAVTSLDANTSFGGYVTVTVKDLDNGYNGNRADASTGYKKPVYSFDLNNDITPITITATQK